MQRVSLRIFSSSKVDLQEQIVAEDGRIKGEG
jgi:hypothetical protein